MFEVGDKVKCVYSEGAVKGLKKDEIYTIKSFKSTSVGDYCEVEEINNPFGYFPDRFKKVSTASDVLDALRYLQFNEIGTVGQVSATAQMQFADKIIAAVEKAKKEVDNKVVPIEYATAAINSSPNMQLKKDYKQAFKDAIALIGQTDVGAVKRLQKLHPGCFEE